MNALFYLMLTVTFADGSSVIEAKGPAGPTWDDCIKYASYVQYQEKYPRSKPVIKREVRCERRDQLR